MKRSLAILIAGTAGAIAGAAWLINFTAENPPSYEILLNGDAAMRQFLAEYGCEPNEEPPAQHEITLPASGDSTVFSAYCRLQEQQKLPLEEHFGQEAVKWTYSLDSSSGARAELICTPEGILLGAMRYDCRRFDLMYPVICE
ncbi:MAG: DUF4830 domain-containing protein [Oscillospiraceae bacterium]|nr:DUF4830 domain-containing protein [Oscillospiraceae bacterium]